MPAGRQRLNKGQHGHLAPWCLRRLGTGKQLEQGPLRAEPCWKDLLGHFPQEEVMWKVPGEAPEKEVQRLSTLKLTRTKPARWTHCSAMMYSPGRGVQGTPATCTWWAISEKSKPRFTPWMVTRVPPSGGPDTVKICRREVGLATDWIIHRNRKRFLSLPKSKVLRNYDETPRIWVSSFQLVQNTDNYFLGSLTHLSTHPPTHPFIHPLKQQQQQQQKVLNSHKNIPDLCPSLFH